MGWANAQMDNKFYQPSKEMKTFEYSTPVENFSLPVGDDTITAYIIKPSQKEIKKTFFYFHGAAGNVTTYQEMSKPLVDAGYQLLMVDVRGYGILMYGISKCTKLSFSFIIRGLAAY